MRHLFSKPIVLPIIQAACALVVGLSLPVNAQDFKQEFNRQLYIQNFEQVSSEIDNKFQTGLNFAFVDLSEQADYNLVNAVGVMDPHYNYFVASVYNSNTTVNGVQGSGCVIVVNYKNKKTYDDSVVYYQKILNNKELGRNFVDYMIMSHEIGHCLAQQKLNRPNFQAIQEHYADAIASFFLHNSVYQPLIPQWIETLKLHKPPHNTYNYVSNFYRRTAGINSLPNLMRQF